MKEPSVRPPVPILTLSLTILGLVGLAAGCSDSGGTANTTPRATPSPSPTASSAYDTEGNIACTAANEAIPGNYVNIITNGTVVGSTYTGDDSGFNGYQIGEYTAPGATPAPTQPPLTPATPAPSQTPGALGILYYGEYAVPAFTDAESGTPIGASDGCFQLQTNQALGGTVGEARPAQAPTPSAVANGFGNPAFAYPYASDNTCVSEGGGGCSYGFNAITITNLTRTTGSGTFNFTINGSETTVTGTITVTGSTSYPSEPIEDSARFRRSAAIQRR
jgi:hypothetical protein